MAIATSAEDNSGARGRRPPSRRRGCCRGLGTWRQAMHEEIRSRNALWYESRVGRLMHLVAKLVAVVGMIFTIMNLTLDYNESPTLTTMESDNYPARDVAFPGVAICSMNKMSLAAVNVLAEDLYHLESTKTFNVSLGQIKSMMKYLGHLYVFDVDETEIEDAQVLHAILSRAYGDYDIDNIMMHLTPKCRSILKYCAWEGKDRVCDNMFFLRKTQDGFCCTFNYARRSDDFGSTKRSGLVSSMVERSTIISSEYGLNAILNSRLDDYFYKSAPTNGFKVLLFSSLDYPDAPSGSLREIFIPPKSDVFISMDATTIHTTPEVLEYDVSLRNCLFNTEHSKIFQGYYSYSDCIMYCRIRDIIRNCKCIPFFYPRPDDIESLKSCDLDDLLCLKEFGVKWKRVRPRLKKESAFDDSDILRNSSTHLNCDCFPSCDDVAYKISSSTIPLTTNKILWDRYIIPNRNFSMLHIYFDGPNTIRLKQDVLFYWYELMSDYGGICSLFLGISIINVVEIIYTCLNVIFNRDPRIDRDDEVEADDEEPPPSPRRPMPRIAKTRRVAESSSRAPRAPISTVGIISIIDEQPVQLQRNDVGSTQLYWQEFVRPRKPKNLWL